MKMLKKFEMIVMTICLCLTLQLKMVGAAGVSVSASSSSITIGSSFKVRITASDCYTTISTSTNNGSISGAPKDIDSGSASFTVKPSKVGTCTVTISGTYAAYSGNTKDISFSKTVTVTVKDKASKPQPTTQTTTTEKPKEDTRSKENALSSLSVNEGTISPKFSANTTKYTVNLEGNKTKIKIDAKAKDSKAKVSGTGEKNLKVGKNTFVVKCTAENGSTRNYTIIVNVDEKPLVYTEYGKQKLGVVRNLEGVNIPAGFEKSTTQLDGQKIDAWTNKNLNLTISYLVDEQNKKAYYVVENGKIAYEYQIVDIDDRHFVIVPIDNKLKEREGFQFQKVQVREIELDGWTYQDKAMKNYVQVYLMNEKGEKHVYDYESTEAQLQIYTEATKEEKGIDVFMVTTIVFGLTSVALLGLSIYLKKKTNS